MSKPRVIAFYLPQYYPTKFNDEWWEPGFTEWTNVAKAKPLFCGHYQPKLPGELGFYDLRLPETREKQAELAKIAGVESFMYWHYWTDGKKVLNEVIEDVVRTGKPDMNFCLCWANHSWTKCAWNGFDSTTMLMEQKYPGKEDHIRHFYDLLPIFKDSRYTRVNGRLLFAIFSPTAFPEIEEFMSIWNELAEQNGLNGFYFAALNGCPPRTGQLKSAGFDMVIEDHMNSFREHHYAYNNIVLRALRLLFGIVVGNNYVDYCRYYLDNFKLSDGVVPCIYPNWDHSARSGKIATIFRNAEPKIWGKFCTKLFDKMRILPHDRNIVFIKSWNEWGEGNYMEPDRRYKRGYINELREAIDNVD